MKIFYRLIVGICGPFVFCLTISAQVEIPEYSSTFNTGLGKQQRLNAVEDQLKVLTISQKAGQKKLYEQTPSKEELDQLEKELKNSQATIKDLKTQVDQLKTQNLELLRKLERVDTAELRELMDFVRSLKEADLKNMKQEIEGLKLTIRSMQAVIESMHQGKDSASP